MLLRNSLHYFLSWHLIPIIYKSTVPKFILATHLQRMFSERCEDNLTRNRKNFEDPRAGFFDATLTRDRSNEIFF